jgi:hypothetical protein
VWYAIWEIDKNGVAGHCVPMRALLAALGALRRRPTHVVPLGCSCRVTHQARTYFGSVESYPFDWWISPLDGIARYLEDPDPALIFADGCLHEVRGTHGEVASIYSPDFGFQLLHEFPRRVEQAGPPEVTAVVPDWRRQVDAAAARHVRRLARLQALDRRGRRILFVRDHLSPDPDDARDPRPAVEHLWTVLQRRFPLADVALLLVNLRLPEPLSPPILAVDFVDPAGTGPDAWKGDPARWSAAFASAGFARRRRGVAPAPAWR